MLPTTQKNSEKIVLEATKFGISVVQEIAAQVLTQKPGMSLKEFTKVLDKYVGNIHASTSIETTIITPPPKG